MEPIKKLEYVIREFVYKLICQGKDIPVEVVHCLLPNGEVIPGNSSNDDIVNFSRKLDQFVKTNYKLKSEKGNDINKVQENILLKQENCVLLYQTVDSLVDKKCQILVDILNELKGLLGGKLKLQQIFNEHTTALSLTTSQLHYKAYFVKSKLESLIKAQPTLLKALKKLQELVSEERGNYKKLVYSASEKEVRYEEMKTDPEFLKLLLQYQKLLKTKASLGKY